MRLFFVMLCCFVVAVVARPEAGYTYNGLQQNGLPQNVHQQKPLVHQQLPPEHSFASYSSPPSSPQLTYGAPATNSVEHVAIPVVPAEPDSYNVAYHHSSLQHESGYDNAPQKTAIHKHIYVHVPPKGFEEEDAIQPRVHHQVGPKQKHYKIVFIKAPAAPVLRAPIISPPPQNEEKTLIYVLHKKPDTVQDIVVPTAAPVKPSKPEVFFIKYKTKKDDAPVYGPPPQVQTHAQNIDLEPRDAQSPPPQPSPPQQPSMEYGAPTTHSIDNSVESGNTDLQQPTLEKLQPVVALDEQPPHESHELPTPTLYSAPTVPTLNSGEEHILQHQLHHHHHQQQQQQHQQHQHQQHQQQHDDAELNNQYLAPTTSAAQILSSEEVHDHLPAQNYGPPTAHRIFLKKKK